MSDFMYVTVVDYDPDWPIRFQDEAKHIERIMGENLVRVFHIGSTSVPGMKAKPIIDLMAVVYDLDLLDSCEVRLKAVGYEAKGAFGISGRRYFRKGGENRTHQLHCFQAEDGTNILRHLAFRDYLRGNAEVQKAYSSLKEALAVKFPRDIEEYCQGKEAFVRETERNALAWYWRQYAR